MWRREKWIWLLLAVLAVAAWGWPRGSAELRVQGQAPEITAGAWFNTPDSPSIEGLRGKVVVLEFWATWCPPCLDAVPHLNKLHEDLRDRDTALIALTDEPPDRVSPFLRVHDIRYIVGAGSRAGDAYGVRAIPAAVVIDREGRIVWRGYPDRQLDRAIEKALAAG